MLAPAIASVGLVLMIVALFVTSVTVAAGFSGLALVMVSAVLFSLPARELTAKGVTGFIIGWVLLLVGVAAGVLGFLGSQDLRGLAVFTFIFGIAGLVLMSATRGRSLPFHR